VDDPCPTPTLAQEERCTFAAKLPYRLDGLSAMLVSASQIIGGFESLDYVFWKEYLIFGKSLDHLSLGTSKLIFARKKEGEPKLPVTEATEAISVQIESCRAQKSCLTCENSAGL